MFEIGPGQHGEVVLTGRLDAAQCARAQAYLDSVPALSTLDLTHLDYISSAGLGVLLKTQKRLMQTGRGLRLINVSNHINDILRYSGLDRIFTIERTPAQDAGSR
jgi:anti-anti-sigma factor